jgi:allantoate deiminase
MSELDGTSIEARLKELARHTSEPGRMTRLYLSPEHRAAMDLVAQRMRDAGMEVHVDAAANVVGRYAGATPNAKTLLIGSHIDTVRNAGIYDGNLGVVTGIAVVAELHRTGRRLPFAIEVFAFGDEEGVRFSTTLSGSRAVAGRFVESCLDERDAGGKSRRELLAGFGCDVGQIAHAARNPSDILGYLEVHIEQGPVLEAKGLPLGIVTAINGCSRGEVRVVGMAGHAGTLPMDMRQDALAAAAEMVLAVETRGRAEVGLVATVGVLDMPFGAINVVPGKVRFTLDVRSPDDANRHRAVVDIRDALERIAKGRGVSCEIDMSYDAPAAPCDGALMDMLSRAVGAQGVEPFRLPSGAGHDAMSFRDLWPMAMLFVRCRGGVSHNPAEYASPEDIGLGAKALFEFLHLLGARK